MAAKEAARGAVWEGVAARAVMEERAARVAVGEAAAAHMVAWTHCACADTRVYTPG